MMWRMRRGEPSEEANRELKQKMGWLTLVIVEMEVERFSDRIFTLNSLDFEPFYHLHVIWQVTSIL